MTPYKKLVNCTGAVEMRGPQPRTARQQTPWETTIRGADSPSPWLWPSLEAASPECWSRACPPSHLPQPHTSWETWRTCHTWPLLLPPLMRPSGACSTQCTGSPGVVSQPSSVCESGAAMVSHWQGLTGCLCCVLGPA
jgi:hypothetical protein